MPWTIELPKAQRCHIVAVGLEDRDFIELILANVENQEEYQVKTTRQGVKETVDEPLCYVFHCINPP